MNDRPYAASSMLAVAIKEVFRTALTGRCASHQELADSAIPLELHVPALPCRGGIDLARRVFEPLGWQVAAAAAPLDPAMPGWGESRYLDVRLAGTVRLADALNHLYVLLPVLDDAKHYWVSTDEVDKLVRAGGDWLAGHPEKELITRRYLAHKRELTRDALARLAEVDDAEPEDLDNALEGARIAAEPDQPAPLSEQRRGAVLAVVRAAGAPASATSAAARACWSATCSATTRSSRWWPPTCPRGRCRSPRASSGSTDERACQGAAADLPVFPHLPRRPAAGPGRGSADGGHRAHRPATAGGDRARRVQARGPVHRHRHHAERRAQRPLRTLPPGTPRHRDHRFEWTRAEFRDWAAAVAERNGYRVRFLPVGGDDPEVGPPTQMAVFDKVVGPSRPTTSRPAGGDAMTELGVRS